MIEILVYKSHKKFRIDQDEVNFWGKFGSKELVAFEIWDTLTHDKKFNAFISAFPVRKSQKFSHHMVREIFSNCVFVYENCVYNTEEADVIQKDSSN